MTFNVKISGIEPSRALVAEITGTNLRVGITDVDGIGLEAAVTITPESAANLGAWLTGWSERELRLGRIAAVYPEAAAEARIAGETRASLVDLLEDLTSRPQLGPSPETMRRWAFEANNILPHLKRETD